MTTHRLALSGARIRPAASRSATSMVRFPYKTAHDDPEPLTMAEDHAAVTGARTIFPSTVRAWDDEVVLKTGHNSPKIGRMVVKGEWTGFPIFCLTLEERGTCPTSCREWRSCYGNRMPFAHRFQAGPVLEERIEAELVELQAKHPQGFVIRLHVLGDFYSAAYVDRWADWLEAFPALHIFGYTAWPETSPIGRKLNAMRRGAAWRRFALRFSNGDPTDGPASMNMTGPVAPAHATRCPAQSGQSLCCGTCTLCWSAPGKVIAFSRH